MIEWVEQLMSSMGYLGVVFLMFIENVFPPIPSELIMPLAGFTASRGTMTLWGVILAGMLGSVLGALPLYAIGRMVGIDRLRRWAGRYGKWVLVRPSDIDAAEAWFRRHGGMAVLICRVVPGVRSLISIPAGAAEMHLVPFVLYTAIGTTMWAALLAYLGSMLGRNYGRIEDVIEPISYIVTASLGLVIVIWFVKRWRSMRRQPTAPEPDRS